MLALWNIDLAFADVVATTVTPQLGEIRLAWWRERLEDLDKGVGPPAEPRLQAVAATLIPAGVTGAELSQLEDCWLTLLGPLPWGSAQADAVAKRGTIIFGIAARLLGREAAEGEPIGAVWSLAEAAQHVSDPESRAVLRDRAKLAIIDLPTKRTPAELAPFLMIAARRTYDLLHGDRGRWHRVMWGLRASWFGIIPR